MVLPRQSPPAIPDCESSVLRQSSCRLTVECSTRRWRSWWFTSWRTRSRGSLRCCESPGRGEPWLPVCGTMLVGKDRWGSSGKQRTSSILRSRTSRNWPALLKATSRSCSERPEHTTSPRPRSPLRSNIRASRTGGIPFCLASAPLARTSGTLTPDTKLGCVLSAGKSCLRRHSWCQRAPGQCEVLPSRRAHRPVSAAPRVRRDRFAPRPVRPGGAAADMPSRRPRTSRIARPGVIPNSWPFLHVVHALSATSHKRLKWSRSLRGSFA